MPYCGRRSQISFSPRRSSTTTGSLYLRWKMRRKCNQLCRILIFVPARTLSIGIAQPADGLPHLPGVITNVTVDQALDLVAKTFRGIVLYEFCTPPNQFQIDFANAGYI